jgi:hypothetical protein
MKYEILAEYVDAQWDKNGSRYDSINWIYVDLEIKKLYTFNSKIPKKDLSRIEELADITVYLDHEKMIETKPFQSEKLELIGIESLYENKAISTVMYNKLIAKIRQLKIDFVLDD